MNPSLIWSAWFFGLWWTVDDHLAAALNAPGLGSLPVWVVALVALMLAPMNDPRKEGVDD